MIRATTLAEAFFKAGINNPHHPLANKVVAALCNGKGDVKVPDYSFKVKG